MEEFNKLINQIAQDKIDFNPVNSLLLSHTDFNFLLRNYIFKSIPYKINYNSDAYTLAISTILLKLPLYSLQICHPNQIE